MTDHKSLAEALLAFQADPPKLHKDQVNPAFRSKYVSLGAVMDAVLPALNVQGLVWTTLPSQDERGEAVLSYRLTHAATSEVVAGTMPLLLSKRDPQGLGSALTYSRRQALMAVVGVVADDDDDGNRASGGRTTQVSRQHVSRQQAHGQGAKDRILTDDERSRVLAEVGRLGLRLSVVLRDCGIESLDEATLANARTIRAHLDKIEADRAMSDIPSDVPDPGPDDEELSRLAVETFGDPEPVE